MHAVDPFDLPDWLGASPVTWTAEGPLGHGLVAGELAGGGRVMACDLLAVDRAFPRPAVEEAWRRLAHEHWSREQVLTLRLGDRLTLAAPGTALTAEDALLLIGRLARAVGVRPEAFLVALRPRA